MEVFLGRDGELAELVHALDGGGRFSLITGEPGIGKSRLASELCSHAARRGIPALWGRAWEGEGTPAYWPWLEILRGLAADSKWASLVAAARASSAPFAALLDGRPLAVGPGEAQPARFQLLDAVASLTRAAAAASPLVLVLDDLHAADRESLELLAFVARGLRGSALTIIGTARDASFAIRPEIVDALARLAREATTVPLGRLSRELVTRWVELASPALRDRAGRVFENSDGNPLFVRELIAAWQRDVPAKPFAIGEAIRAHTSLISVDARRALERASVLGRDLSRAALRALDVDPAAIDAAVASGLLVVHTEDQLRFSHVLVRDELYAGLPTTTREELHVTAARQFTAEPEQAARHVLAAPNAFPAPEATAIVCAAIAAARDRLAYEEAARLAGRVLDALASSLGPGEEAALRIALGEVRCLAGDGDRGRADCARAAELAATVGDAELLARAALAHATESRLGRHPATVSLLRRAIAAEPADPRLRVQLVARLATALIPATPEEGDEPVRLAREALSAARALQDDATMVTTAMSLLVAFPYELGVGERYALGAEIIALARRTGQLARVAAVPGWQIACWIELGRMDGVHEELRVMERLIGELPAHHAWRVSLVRGLVAALEGRFTEAAGIARAQLASAQGEGAIMSAVALMALPYLSGDPASFAADEPMVTRTLSALPGHQIFHSLAEAHLGRAERVDAAMTQARALDMSALPGAAQLGWPVAACGLATHAGWLYELAAQTALVTPIMFTPGAVMTSGLLDVLAAQLAHLAGREDRVAGHLVRARAFAERFGAPGLLAQLARAERVLGGRPVARVDVESPSIVLERRGELWAVSARGREHLLEHRVGLDYLAALVAAPHRELHVLELTGGEDDGDAGPLLDDRAKRAYRQRADALREELAEAEAFADLGRSEKARAELEALASELVRASGLGGRDRKAGSASERARVNVQRRLRDVIRRVGELDPGLGRHLELSVRTGAFCRYAPTWP